MTRAKHQPQRRCVVCRQQTHKRDLVRIVRTSDGIFIDPTGRMQGRGAYVCDNPVCREKARNGKAIAGALRTSLNEADRERLRELAL